MKYTIVFFILSIMSCTNTFLKRELLLNKTVSLIPANNSNIRIIGRSLPILGSNSIAYDWSAVTVAFTTSGTCKRVSLRITGERSQFSVYLNGILQKNIIRLTTKGVNDILIASNLKNKTEIRFLKRTEGFYGTTVILDGILLEGSNCKLIAPPKPSERFIQYIGASNLCAFGVEGGRKDDYNLDFESYLNSPELTKFFV